MRRLPQWHHALVRIVWIWSNYTVKCHAAYHSTLPFSLCHCLGEGMTRKRENLVHKIFVCAAIFKLRYLEYGANFKLEHYRVKIVSCDCFGLFSYTSYHSTDNSVDAILQKFSNDILKDVNAKECAPELKQKNLIAESTATGIAEAKDAQTARRILFDHIHENSTSDQIVQFSRVLMRVDAAFGKTRKVGERLHAEIQGLVAGGTDQKISASAGTYYN